MRPRVRSVHCCSRRICARYGESRRAYLSRASGMSAGWGRRRALPALLALLAVSLTGSLRSSTQLHASQGLQPSWTSETSELLKTYCVTCHNSRLKTAGLQLDTLDLARIGDHAARWEKV